MKTPQLEQLVAALRAGGPDLSASPQEIRAGFSQMVSSAPVASDIEFESLRLGSVRALASLTPGAVPERMLLYLHGGAFVIGSPHDYRSLSAELGRAVGGRAVCPDYRLAPEHPFPAAVEDALAAYRGLLEHAGAPGNIVLAGDSAGGGLVVSVLVAARDAGLPMPAAALAISPWVDLACQGRSMQTKLAEDPALTREGLLAMAGLYLKGTPPDAPLASPLNANLSGLPPLLIQVGSAEILLDDAVQLAGRAGEAGVRVQLSVWPDMPHVWHFFGFMLPEGRQAIAEAAGFLGAQLNRGQASRGA
jgi:epsilon-lactone hydrolase